jgi:hypothetical protein
MIAREDFVNKIIGERKDKITGIFLNYMCRKLNKLFHRWETDLGNMTWGGTKWIVLAMNRGAVA